MKETRTAIEIVSAAERYQWTRDVEPGDRTGWSNETIRTAAAADMAITLRDIALAVGRLTRVVDRLDRRVAKLQKL